VPAPEVTEDPNAIQRSLVGLHIEGAEGGAWASAPFGSLRLWDNGTGWSQIELSKGEFKWDNLEGVLENAASKGMEDILYVLGTTPEWAAQEVNEADYPQPGAASAPANLEPQVLRQGVRQSSALRAPHGRTRQHPTTLSVGSLTV
jgi:hypothetical protein